MPVLVKLTCGCVFECANGSSIVEQVDACNDCSEALRQRVADEPDHVAAMAEVEDCFTCGCADCERSREEQEYAQ